MEDFYLCLKKKFHIKIIKLPITSKIYISYYRLVKEMHFYDIYIFFIFLKMAVNCEFQFSINTIMLSWLLISVITSYSA